MALEEKGFNQTNSTCEQIVTCEFVAFLLCSQEEYVDGDELGKIDCGLGYHVSCIQQWLVQKNQCPICKATALS
jgi:hypothetical protein